MYREAVPDPPLPVGTAAPWFPPGTSGPGVRPSIVLANSRVLKRMSRRFATVLSPPRMRADLGDVVVICFAVPAEQLRPFVPLELDLERLDDGGRWTLLSLTLLHNRRMGPRILGPIRRLTSATRQLDWRAHVRFAPGDGRDPIRGVYVLSGAVDSTARAVAVRMWSEGLPMHRPERFDVATEHGPIRIDITAGEGTAPDLHGVLQITPETPGVPEPFDTLFDSWDHLMARALAPQRLLSVQGHLGWVSATEWRIQLDEAQCRPVEVVELASRFGDALHGGAPAVAFFCPAGGILDVHPPLRLPLKPS